jgi:ABC-type transport system involved in multi-copper enzyme maturation permease subunit
MRQTLAIFLDAYRELNSRKLFWIVLAISGLIVVVFGMVGVDSGGLTFLHWSLNFGPSTAIMSQEFFYKQIMFVGLGIKFWLTWVATILALVSTAGMMPEFVSSGSIDLALAKPITRARMFLTKYLAGLLFVALQVSIFAVAYFLIIGLRGGAWEPRVLLAVPLVVAFFSYLYCICTFLGLLTRSGIASLLITLLIWACCFLITSAESGIVMGKAYNDQRVEVLDRSINAKRQEIEDLSKSQEKGVANVMNNAFKLPVAKSTLERLETKQVDAKSWQRIFNRLDLGAYAVKTVLPKMSETNDLLDRSLLSEKDRRDLTDPPDDTPDLITSDDPDVKIDGKKLQKKVVEHKLTQPIWWVLGTSFGFEAIVLGICTWIFCRRDF